MKKGFTLVELLVVIAILAVLGTAVVVVLNPAELIKQGRDATRISDLQSVNKSIALYLSQIDTPGLGGANDTSCPAGGEARCAGTTTTDPFANATNENGCGSGTGWATTSVDGNGWVAVDLANISIGSPLSRLPQDPVNSNVNFYGYACLGTTYELIANFESTKYVPQETADGGNQSNLYEVGSAVSL